jgi:molybdate transport system regulatory protein
VVVSDATEKPRRRAGPVRSTKAAKVPKPQIRILFRKAIAMGPGKASLLEAIERTGSISAAARDLEMSYRRAWLLVDTMNQCFRQPLVSTETGGQKGGGAHVTEFGHEVLRRYLDMEAKAAASVDAEMAQFVKLMAKGTLA